MSFRFYSLKVVESVRELGLSLRFHNGREMLVYPKNINKSLFKERLINMLKALEEFDENTGKSDNLDLTYEKNIFQEKSKLEKEDCDLESEFVILSEPKKELTGVDPVSDRAYDLEEVFEDSGSDHNLGDSLDAIMDKLEFAVTKVGWTPKMRILAAALKNAEMKRLSIDKELDESFLIEWKRVLEISLDMIFTENDNKIGLNHRQQKVLKNDMENVPKYNKD